MRVIVLGAVVVAALASSIALAGDYESPRSQGLRFARGFEWICFDE